jgi:hypothetical protein
VPTEANAELRCTREQVSHSHAGVLLRSSGGSTGPQWACSATSRPSPTGHDERLCEQLAIVAVIVVVVIVIIIIIGLLTLEALTMVEAARHRRDPNRALCHSNKIPQSALRSGCLEEEQESTLSIVPLLPVDDLDWSPPTLSAASSTCYRKPQAIATRQAATVHGLWRRCSEAGCLVPCILSPRLCMQWHSACSVAQRTRTKCIQ